MVYCDRSCGHSVCQCGVCWFSVCLPFGVNSSIADLGACVCVSAGSMFCANILGYLIRDLPPIYDSGTLNT